MLVTEVWAPHDVIHGKCLYEVVIVTTRLHGVDVVSDSDRPEDIDCIIMKCSRCMLMDRISNRNLRI